MTITPDPQGWYALERDVDPAIVQQLAQLGPIEKLSLTKIPLITVKIARRLASLRVDQLWLWCDVTRRAMQHIIQLPGLRVLDVLCIQGPGQMANFGAATDLEILRANHYMTEADLLQVTQCSQLHELGAQNSELTYKSMSAILSLPSLTALDLEATRFDDKMARQTSRSKTITSLEIGGTLITRMGLEHLVQMEQLQSLDLWSTTLNEGDLRLLLNLPHLEYLSLGTYDDRPPLNADEITKLLLDCPSLKRVWLSGIQLETSQKQALESKLDSLRITSYDDAS
jgi:hypothetical protein